MALVAKERWVCFRLALISADASRPTPLSVMVHQEAVLAVGGKFEGEFAVVLFV